MKPLLVVNLATLGTVVLAMAAFVAALHGLERATSRVVAHHWGWRGVLVTGWLGVPLHELSHLVSALLFGHRIVAFSFFDPDPTTGTLGYVRHAPSRSTAWQRFGNLWIGVAPALAGSIALWFLLSRMLPPALLLESAMPFAAALDARELSAAPVLQALVGAIATLGRGAWQARSWWLPLQLYGCIAIACHMAPGRADLRAGWSGLSALVVGLVLTCVVAAYYGAQLTVVLGVLPVALLVIALVAAFQGLWVLVVVVSS